MSNAFLCFNQKLQENFFSKFFNTLGNMKVKTMMLREQ